jgi:hypothetical protein
MTIDAMNPPRWAEAMLRSFVRPSDRESISGDLLEEYRAARRPLLGALGANIWYIKHVLSVLWQLIRPVALAMAGLSILLALTVFRPGHHAPHQSPATQPMLWSLMVKGIWYGSIVPCPGTSLLDAVIYFWAGYHAFQRTRLIRAGLLTAAATSVVGTTVLFAAAAIITPGLVLAVVVNPLLLLILSVYLLIPLGYAVLLGALAGVVGRWLPPGTLIRRLNLDSVHFG